MSFTIITYSPMGSHFSKEADTIAQAREAACEVVNERMEAFGEDRDALNRYGFIDAEDRALAMSEEGGTIFLQDGWKIEIINDNIDDDKE